MGLKILLILWLQADLVKRWNSIGHGFIPIGLPHLVVLLVEALGGVLMSGSTRELKYWQSTLASQPLCQTVLATSLL